MEQLNVVGAMNSMWKLCVVQRNKSKHLCEHKVDQLQGILRQLLQLVQGQRISDRK